MENNFDKEVKKSLENLEVEYTPMDWNLMEEKIEEHSDLHPELEDALIDGMAFDSLQNLEEDYNPEHWNLMREKLDAVYAFRRKLMKYKVAEVALVAFFIFTLFQFLPIKKSNTSNLISNTVKEINQTNTPVISSDYSQETSNQKQEIDSQTISKSISENTLSTESKKLNTTVQKPISSNPPSILNTLAANSSTSKNNLEEKNSAQPTLESTVVVSDLWNIDNENNQTVNSFEDLNINTSLLNPILLKDAEKLKIASIEELNGGKVFSDLKKPIKVRVGMAIGADANYIMTPYNQKDLLESFNQFAPGYSGGFTLGFQYGKWEVETGALYSSVSYKSRNIYEIKGSFAEGGYVQQGLEGAQIDLVRLPLNLRYNFFDKKKWNVYAYTGTSVNMMVETFYNFTTTEIGNSLGARGFESDGRGTGNEEELKYESHDGIFEGGQLSNNIFMTANIGFGVEKYFTPRMSIFLQPGYQHQFSKGLGPQADQINSISILTGAKVTLKKRKKSK